MSTITETQPVAAPGVLEWVPAPESLYRMTIEKYEALVRSGVFTSPPLKAVITPSYA